MALTYPATNNSEAIDLNIDSANRWRSILTGDVNTIVETFEGGGTVPSISKALADLAAYKSPLEWASGETETDLLQPRSLNDFLFVPLRVPAPMDALPSDAYWKVYLQNITDLSGDTGYNVYTEIVSGADKSVFDLPWQYDSSKGNLFVWVDGTKIPQNQLTFDDDDTVTLSTAVTVGQVFEVASFTLASSSIITSIVSRVQELHDETETFHDETEATIDEANVIKAQVEVFKDLSEASKSSAEISAAASAASAASASDSEISTLAAVADLQTSIDEAIDITTSAEASANYLGEWALQTGAATVPTSVLYNEEFWNLVADIGDITTEVPGISNAWILPSNVRKLNEDTYSVIKGIHYVNNDTTITNHWSSSGYNYDLGNIKRTIDLIAGHSAIMELPDGTYNMGGNNVTIPANIEVKVGAGFEIANGMIEVLGAHESIVVNTLADLRAVKRKFKNCTARVLGQDIVGDSGGGPLRYFKTGGVNGTYVDNNKDIIVPDGGNGGEAWLNTAADVQYLNDVLIDIVEGEGVEAKATQIKADMDQLYINTQLTADGIVDSLGADRIYFATKALMDLDLAHAENTIAQVMSDPIPDKNRNYIKSGASGVGSWLPSSIDRVTATAAVADDVKAELQTYGADFQMSQTSVLNVSDEDGNALFLLNADGGIKSALISIESDLSTTDTSFSTAAHSVTAYQSKTAFSIADEEGYTIFAIGHDGRVIASGYTNIAQGENPLGINYNHDINHLITYGQSLSVGQALPVQTLIQKYDNIAFVRGQTPQYDFPLETASEWYASFIPAIESTSPEEAVLGETPSGGAGDMIKARILAEDGKAYTDHNYQMLLSAPGWGATTIAQLSKGGSHYSRLLDQVQYGLDLSNAEGKTYATQAVTWTQGESDYLIGTTKASYLTKVQQLVADIQTDVTAITNQTVPVEFISYQLASHIHGGSSVPTIALALLEAAESNPLMHIATPMYHVPYEDGFHLTGVGSRWLGGYYGLAYKRIVINGEAWKPLQPISTVRQGTIVEVNFHVPYGRLEWDTTQVTANTNMGFDLVDSGGTPLGITSVSIQDTARVRIIADAPVPAGAKIRYAWSGGATGPVTGPRGNLRDNQGDIITFDIGSENKRMDNWCVIFEMEV